MTMRWLEKKVDFLGALDAASNAQAKALLASFDATDGAQCITGYGLELGDVDPNTWATRDGKMLACFANWWTAQGKTPALPFSGSGAFTWIDLKAEHLAALQQWGLSKGVINPGQIPTPPIPVPTAATCALACQQKYATDPQNLATCLAICASTAPPLPVPAPPPNVNPPLPAPPAPMPAPAPAASSEGIGVAGVLAIVGAVLGLGALILSR